MAVKITHVTRLYCKYCTPTTEYLPTTHVSYDGGKTYCCAERHPFGKKYCQVAPKELRPDSSEE